MVDTITLISAVVALFSAVIALLAERRARQIEKRIRLAQMLAMYADIGYGDLTNRHPWDISMPQFHEEYQQWLIRFFSYNGRVNKEIREDYEYIVKCYIEYPKDEKIKMNEIPTRMKRVREYARMRVKELGDVLGDA